MLLCFFLSLLLPSFSSAAPLLHFQYVTNDGLEALDCDATRLGNLPDDFDVSCGGGKKKFSAHVIVRGGAGEKVSGFELLYWVTEPGQGNAGAHFNATTTWIHLKGKADLAALSFSQAVENDYASLMLDYQP